MKYTKSREYKLPGSLYCFVGNLVLRVVRWVPSPARYWFVRNRSYYQVFSEAEVGERQGLSIKKWEALQMPFDLKGMSVVDIGCSEGFFSQECAKRGAGPVLGVDSSLGRLIYASFISLKKGLDVRYRMGVFPSTGFRHKFDFVLCLSVLHHSLSKKDVWKVLAHHEFAEDLKILREQLRVLRSLTNEKGRCVLEIPYEYDNPDREREVVDFQTLSSELKAAGFADARCLGTWDYNGKHRAFKDRIIYVAEA